MKNISIRELNSILCQGHIFAGATVNYGKNVYRIDRLKNGVAWICYMPKEKFYKNFDEYNHSSVGWNALLRIS